MEPPEPDVPPFTDPDDRADNSEPIVRIPKSVPTPPMGLWNGRPTRPRYPAPKPAPGGRKVRTTKIAGMVFADMPGIMQAAGMTLPDLEREGSEEEQEEIEGSRKSHFVAKVKTRQMAP